MRSMKHNVILAYGRNSAGLPLSLSRVLVSYRKKKERKNSSWVGFVLSFVLLFFTTAFVPLL